MKWWHKILAVVAIVGTLAVVEAIASTMFVVFLLKILSFMARQ